MIANQINNELNAKRSYKSPDVYYRYIVAKLINTHKHKDTDNSTYILYIYIKSDENIKI